MSLRATLQGPELKSNENLGAELCKVEELNHLSEVNAGRRKKKIITYKEVFDKQARNV